VLVGADDVHLNFAGGIAAEAGTVLHEDDAGGGDGGADTSKAAASDEDVGIEADFAHVEFGAGHGRVGRRDAIEVDGTRCGGLLGCGIAGQYDEGVGEELAAVHGGIVSGVRVRGAAL